jgi:hypothetical protein
MEKTEVEVSRVERQRDYFGWLLALALGLLALEGVGRWLVFRGVV